ncbi:MAG: type II toxin-antitoxin system VapC family toxin [Spirochaetes bacterium]|nr:type II toxin-antitoxin system VapC family toxin [Spirochaetota bacterium]
MILLDTHIWVWLIAGSDKLRKSGLLGEILTHAKSSTIRIAAISMWEVAMLEAKKRLSFSESTQQWLEHASAAPGLAVEPITPKIAFESANLPGIFHGDPADRLIVATARVSNLSLCTVDENILRYAAAGHVKIAREIKKR